MRCDPDLGSWMRSGSNIANLGCGSNSNVAGGSSAPGCRRLPHPPYCSGIQSKPPTSIIVEHLCKTVLVKLYGFCSKRTFSLSDGAALQHRFPVLHAAGGTEINHFKHFKHRLFFYTHWASPKNDNDSDNADNDSLSLDCDN